MGALDVGAVTEGGLAAATEGAEVIYNLGADEVEIAAGPFRTRTCVMRVMIGK